MKRTILALTLLAISAAQAVPVYAQEQQTIKVTVEPTTESWVIRSIITTGILAFYIIGKRELDRKEPNPRPYDASADMASKVFVGLAASISAYSWYKAIKGLKSDAKKDTKNVQFQVIA